MNKIRLRISSKTEAKIWAKHKVSVQEVQEVFNNEEYQVKIRRSDAVADSYTAFGRTFAGRYLMIAFFPKERGYANLGTSREMTARERKRYERK
ncbi:MAG: BrnT family toxin [Deltaproteobacteria bacterium]|nr:BrnT family toxin [Deltaproteobacteria bacterium]